MRLTKLFVVGLGAAALSLTLASNAGAAASTITSMSSDNSRVPAGDFASFTVKGTGKCRLELKLVDPNGDVQIDSDTSNYARQLPTTVSYKAYVPGHYKATLTTLADPEAPDCAAGQTLTGGFDVFTSPKCPPGWTKTYEDKSAGAIACQPYDPKITCPAKTQAFFTPTAGVCSTGCQEIQF